MRNPWPWMVLAAAGWLGSALAAEPQPAVRPELSCQAAGPRASCTVVWAAGADVQRVDLESREVIAAQEPGRGAVLRGKRQGAQRMTIAAGVANARFVVAAPVGEVATELRVVIRGGGWILATERWFLLAEGAGVRLVRNHPALLATPVAGHTVAFEPPARVTP